MKIRNLLKQQLLDIFSLEETYMDKETFIPYGKQYISKDDVSAVSKF